MPIDFASAYKFATHSFHNSLKHKMQRQFLTVITNIRNVSTLLTVPFVCMVVLEIQLEVRRSVSLCLITVSLKLTVV